MKYKHITSILIGMALVTVLSLTSVQAQTTLGITTTTDTHNAVDGVAPEKRLPKLIARGDAAIDARIAALNKLNARVAELKNVSSAEKTTISSQVQTAISGLTSLKAKIDADTDEATLAVDVKSITGSYRIYMLVIPQGYIASAADRIQTVGIMMTDIAVKLQARITADQTAGKDVTALQTLLTDLNAKVSDANSKAVSAQASVSVLTPDQGDKARADANTAALKAARASIKTAMQDLQAARADAKKIIDGPKPDNKASVKTSAGASVNAQ